MVPLQRNGRRVRIMNLDPIGKLAVFVTECGFVRGHEFGNHRCTKGGRSNDQCEREAERSPGATQLEFSHVHAYRPSGPKSSDFDWSIRLILSARRSLRLAIYLLHRSGRIHAVLLEGNETRESFVRAADLDR